MTILKTMITAITTMKSPLPTVPAIWRKSNNTTNNNRGNQPFTYNMNITEDTANNTTPMIFLKKIKKIHI